ncbi:hypothetical protein Cni_G19612 [Canna indica]|uniref:Uncharacterized protein n=1 Tax=Canna indica TaxID=4628 RepID=A0AAQ3KPT5_9LILI|nr:hypothetical protein Cni_G19612 [Canna indica]
MRCRTTLSSSTADSAGSTTYVQALKATESLGQPAEGFVKPASITQKFSETLFKQLNTLIQLTVQIKEELEDLKEEVKTLKEAASLR